MKRIFPLILILLMLLPACHAEPKHTILSQPNTVYYATLAELEAASDAILRVTRQEDAKSQLTRNGDALTNAETISTVAITQVFKDTSNSLTPGDTIPILEHAAYDEEANTVYHQGDYILMEENAEYLLFLIDSNSCYVPAGFCQGIISLTADNRDTPIKTSEGITIPNWNAYREIWQAAVDKYTS